MDHLRLLPGVYVSRRDTLPGGGGEVTTLDVRMTAPNREGAIDGAILHAIEHLAATALRNHPVWGPRVVYWGPMGCRTGNYLLLAGHVEAAEAVPLLREVFQWIADFDGPVPGASARDCGNYGYMDLPGARREARRYLERVLTNISPDRLVYPQ